MRLRCWYLRPPTITMLRATRLAFPFFAFAVTAAAQTAVFTGRFPFTSLDAPHERPGGSITRLEEFDFSYVTFGPGAVARTLLPATAMQCYLGDADADGVYTKFASAAGPWKTYFQAIQIGGVFVKAADRGAVTWDRVYFSLRRNAAATGSAAVGSLAVEVFTNNGSSVQTLTPGDWLRLLPNGNVEYFMTAAQLGTALGNQPGAANIGAGALLQANNGDLFYCPVDGGHWVNGSLSGPQNAQDGGIVKIDAANITYDAAGNVASFAPNSARLLINEAAGGPGGSLTVRQMVLNAGAMDRTGVPIVTTGVYGKTCGLAFDPAGGTFASVFDDATGTFTNEPNLLFCSDPGSYAGTIFSTAGNGSVAVVNGVACGSTTPGVPADGSWLGVQLNLAQFEPTLMGFTLCDALSYEPLVLDQNGFGRLPVASSQPTWDVDVFGAPFLPVFYLVTLGPTAVGGTVPSVPLSLLPPLFTADSHADVFLVVSPLTLGIAVTDGFGYGVVSIPNPNTGAFAGTTLMVQGLGLAPTGFTLTTPLLTQLN